MRTRLLQMASQAFPIGGYSHSQGLEAAVECGLVRDEASVLQWIKDVLVFSLGSYEVPCLMEMSAAWREPSETGRETSDARQEAGEAGRLPGCETLVRLNQEFLATRESAELRSATVQMGFSLRALVAVLPELPDGLIETLKAIPEPSLPYVWSGLAAAWSIAPADSVTAYLWSWAENQVLVAMKSVPVGQSSGQRILLKVGLLIEELARRPGAGADTPRSNFAPGLAILSSQHETQYSRLFRS